MQRLNERTAEAAGEPSALDPDSGEVFLRRFQFRLRTVLLVVMAISTAINWVKMGQGGGLNEIWATRRIRPLGAKTEFLDSGRIVELDISGSEHAFRDADLEPLQHLRKLRRLNLARTPVSDTTLAYLTDLPELSELDLSETQVP